MTGIFRKGVGGILIFSSVLKLFAANYMIDLLFSMMPVWWVGWISEGILILVLGVVAVIELGLGLLLWKGAYLPKVLTATIVFLILMLILNSYQWWSGVGDCGCLGGWITIPPEAALLKTSVLLGIAICLKKIAIGI